VRLLGVPKSTVASLLQRLEAAGLTRRGDNPDDARSWLVFPTAKGPRIGAGARDRVLDFERWIHCDGLARIGSDRCRGQARMRNQALELLGERPLFDDADFEAYGASGSTAAGTLPRDELKRFDALGSALGGALERTTLQQLSVAAPFSPTGNANETVGTLLASIEFHEAYHLGQTGLSRRLVGKAGALLAPREVGHNTEMV
jgi:hypothetical protein